MPVVCGQTLATITAASWIWIDSYQHGAAAFPGRDPRSVLAVLAAACVVHLMKEGRLYLILYGTGIPFPDYLKTYCAVTPASMALPWKLGEAFRMSGYGMRMDQTFKGVLIILLDRFMDTTALVTSIGFVWVFHGGGIMAVAVLLIVFLLSILLLCAVFPDLLRLQM